MKPPKFLIFLLVGLAFFLSAAPLQSAIIESLPLDESAFHSMVNGGGWTQLIYFDPLYYTSEMRSSVVFYVKDDTPNQTIMRIHGIDDISHIAHLDSIVYNIPLNDGSYFTERPSGFIEYKNNIFYLDRINNNTVWGITYESPINFFTDIDFSKMNIWSIFPGGEIIPNSMIRPIYKVPYNENDHTYDPLPGIPEMPPPPTAIPEPSTILLLLSGLLRLPFMRKKITKFRRKP